jgi:uncharacterized membrane protein
MKAKSLAALLSLVAAVSFFLAAASVQAADWRGVEKVFGRSGTTQGDMFKITFPRSDLSVKVGEVTVEPGLALTSWLGFKTMGKQTMMMGDLVLLEKEVPLVMSRLATQGVKITALHNHLLNATPVVMYLHVGGQGDPQQLAAAVLSALSLSATPMKAPAPAQAANPAQWAKVESILGKQGQKKGNVISFGFNRKEKISDGGMEIPPFLGVASPINLQMAGGKVAGTGDFVLTANEVNPVIKALLNHHIAVTAVHSHMLTESPRLFFLHFWAYDEPEEVARGLKAALSQMDLSR